MNSPCLSRETDVWHRICWCQSMKVIGSGIIVNDVIIQREYPNGYLPHHRNDYIERVVLDDVGGTCGNVLTFLAHLGNDVYPQAQFDETMEAHRLSSMLQSYGCNLRFVEHSTSGGMTILTCTHKLNSEGEHKITFRSTGASSMFPKYKFLRAKDEAPAFLSSLDFIPDVYFFDDAASGNRAIAKALREQETLIYYEAADYKGNDTLFRKNLKAMDVSDVVKFSGEHYNRLDVPCSVNQLVIRTLGADGLEYNLHNTGWIHLDAVPVDNVVDWEGAGDWISATFIHELGKRGEYKIENLTQEIVTDCLMVSQIQAARSVQYLGPHGIIHQQEKTR